MFRGIKATELGLATEKEKSAQNKFTLQEERCKRVRGVASIKTYKGDENNYLIEIKPGLAFPGMRKMFNLNALNNKLSLATTFSNELKNVRVRSITNQIHGNIKQSTGCSIRFDKAKYHVENKGSIDIFDTLISKIGRKIYILTRKNAEVDKQLFAQLTTGFH